LIHFYKRVIIKYSIMSESLNNDGGASGGAGARSEGHMVQECNEEENIRHLSDDGVEELYKFGIYAGINFKAYENIPVTVSGHKKLDSINTFEAANFNPILVDNIQKYKFKIPTPVQKNVIPIIMAGRDLMAVAPTGFGKTASFMLPIIHKLSRLEAKDSTAVYTASPQALIITPTRELALKIYNEGRKFAQGSQVKCVVTYGETSADYQTSKQLQQQGCDILVATPGHLLDYVESGKISFKNLNFLVLDEVDKLMEDLGFMQEMEKWVEDKSIPRKRQTLTFSFELPDHKQLYAQEFLENYLFLAVQRVCPDVVQEFIKATSIDKGDKFVSLVKLEEILMRPDRDPTERTLIFTQTKGNCNFLASYLSHLGLPLTKIHGDRPPREREDSVYNFKKGTHPILIATADAVRGMGIRGVAHVINLDVPYDLDDYLHRIGRAGRVGKPGRATSFIDEDSDTYFAGQLVEMQIPSLPNWLAEMARFGGSGNGDFSDYDDEW